MATRRLALAGLIGPPLFLAVVVVLTAAEWDYLHELGWTAGPFDSPDTPWPSSLALGKYGFLQVLAFLLLGLSVVALGIALLRLLDSRRRTGAGLLFLAGLGLLATAFRTDHGSATGGGPETWNGVVHAVGLTVVLPASLAAMFVLAVQFHNDERWLGLASRSLLAAVVAVACAAVALSGSGNFFAIFLLAVLVWLMIVSVRALSLSRVA